MKKIFTFFAIMMMAMQASAWDMVFNAQDTWTTDNSTKSISCTKDGVTLTIAGSQSQVFVIGTGYIDVGMEGTVTITVNAGTATVTGITVANSHNDNFDLTGAGPWDCPIQMGGLKNGSSMPVTQPNSFTVHIQDAPAPTGDVVFAPYNTWTTDNSTKSISCTKDGVTLTIAGSQSQVFVIGTGYIDVGMEGTVTITVNAGTATVTGITVANSHNDNFDLTGVGPWDCPIQMGGLKNGSGMPITQPNSFTVHIENTPTALDNTAAEAKSVKVIENGQVVIIRDGVRYNAVGAKL